jgi:hypothetical protein
MVKENPSKKQDEITLLSVCLWIPLLLTFECLKLGIYIMAPEPIFLATIIVMSPPDLVRNSSFCTLSKKVKIYCTDLSVSNYSLCWNPHIGKEKGMK